MIQNKDNKRVAYDSLVVSKPRMLSALNSELAIKILEEMARQPSCPMDVARKLKIHEQKVYYHVRNLEKNGFIYPVSTEKRYGTVAKIFSVVSPVIATKIFEGGFELKDESKLIPPETLKLLSPFIEDGILNAKLIIGDPAPHGKYDSGSVEAVHALDFVIFLSQFVKEFNFPHYKLDTEIKDEDLKNNLILFGNPKSHTIIEKINSHLPAYFDVEKNVLLKKNNGKSYQDERTGVIVKSINPLNPEKKILYIGGVGFKGIRASVIAFTKYFNILTAKLQDQDNFAVIVEGLDKDGDSIIDDVKFVE